MSKLLTVRFLNNFIMSVVQTYINDEGEIDTKTNTFHIQLGDTYDIDQFQRYEDDKLDLHFPDGSPLAGIAFRIEGDYCAINEPLVLKPITGGCGGCGGRQE